jgi:hypothetical protein
MDGFIAGDGGQRVSTHSMYCHKPSIATKRNWKKVIAGPHPGSARRIPSDIVKKRKEKQKKKKKNHHHNISISSLRKRNGQ